MKAFASVAKTMRTKFLYVDLGAPRILTPDMLEDGQQEVIESEPNSADFFSDTKQWQRAFRKWVTPAVVNGWALDDGFRRAL